MRPRGLYRAIASIGDSALAPPPVAGPVGGGDGPGSPAGWVAGMVRASRGVVESARMRSPSPVVEKMDFSNRKAPSALMLDEARRSVASIGWASVPMPVETPGLVAVI